MWIRATVCPCHRLDRIQPIFTARAAALLSPCILILTQPHAALSSGPGSSPNPLNLQRAHSGANSPGVPPAARGGGSLPAQPHLAQGTQRALPAAGFAHSCCPFGRGLAPAAPTRSSLRVSPIKVLALGLVEIFGSSSREDFGLGFLWKTEWGVWGCWKGLDSEELALQLPNESLSAPGVPLSPRHPELAEMAAKVQTSPEGS